MKRASVGKILFEAIAFSVVSLSADRSPAAILSWDGTGTDWNVASSWSTDQNAPTPDPAAPPGASDLAAFQYAISAPQTVNLNAPQAANGLNFPIQASVVIQSGIGTNTLTIGLAGIALPASAGGVSITAPVSLVANQDWANDSPNLLNVTNSVGLGTNTLTVAGQGNVTLGGALSGSGGLTANPLAMLVLNGANTYTGVTNINGGTIVLGNASALGSVAGGTVVSNDGTLDLAGQTLGAEPVGLSGNGVGANGALVNNSANAATLAGTVTLNSPSYVGGTGNITLSGRVTDPGGTSLLTKVGNNTLTLSGTTDNTNLHVAVNSGTLVLAKTNDAHNALAIGFGGLSVNGGIAQLAGTGNDQIWDFTDVTVTSGAFDTNGRNETFRTLYLQGTGINGTGALFNAGTASSIITPTNGTVLTGNATIGVSGQTIQLNGTISGNYALNKVGGGILILTGSNTFTGGLNIQNGTLQISSINNASTNGVLGKNTSVVLGSSGHAAQILYTGFGSTSTSMPFVLDTGGTGEFYVSGVGLNLALNGAIGGAGTLRARGGMITLGASNTFTGGVTIDSGATLHLANAAALNAASPNAVTMNGGTLNLNGYSITIGGLSSSNSAAVVQNPSATAATLTINNATNNTFAGILQDSTSGASLRVDKSGPGTLTLSGNNTFSGGSLIFAGTLVVGSANALGANNICACVQSGGTLDLGGQAIGNKYLDLRGGTGAGGNGALVNSSANPASATGSVTLEASSSVGGSGNITLSGGIFNASILPDPGILTKIGSGTLTLSGASDNVGLQVAVSGGTLVLAKTSSPTPSDVHALGGAASTVSGGTIQLAGTGGDQIYDGASLTVTSGAFDTNGRSETFGISGPFNLQGTGIAGAGALVNTAAASSTITPTNGTVLTGDTTIGVTQSSGSLTLNRGISGNFTLTKVGAGTLTLPGPGSVAGPINVSAGTLAQSGASFTANVTNSGNYIYNSGTFSGRLINSGTATFNANFTAGNGMQNDFSLSIPVGHTIRFNGLGFTNNGTVLISGGDSTIFGRVNNNSGGQILTAGGSTTTFLDDVVNNGSISTSAGARTVFSAIYSGPGTLPGAGVNEFALDVHPGNIPAGLGVIQVSGGAIFDSTAQADIQIAGTTPGTQYDQIHVTGQLALDGTMYVSLIGGFTPAVGNSFDILDWGTLAGTFSVISLPPLSGGLTWNTSQLYTTGTLSVAIVGIPGDFNLNGAVDAADYVVWRKGLGTTYSQSDYNIWRTHFGQPPGSGSGSAAGIQAAVPEPASAWLLIVGTVVATWRGRRIASHVPSSR